MTLDKPMTFFKWVGIWYTLSSLVEKYLVPEPSVWWIIALDMAIIAYLFHSLKVDERYHHLPNSGLNVALDERFLTKRQAEAIRKAEQN